MEFKMEPVKNQKFDIGRTINWTKCDCQKCDFLHCPKNNYALKMQQHKYTIKEFFEANKEDIIKAGALQNYFTLDTISDFMDACIGKFPKGTYWDFSYDTLEFVSQNRSKYGPDFLPRCEIQTKTHNFKIVYYQGCTSTQEKFAIRVQKKIEELNDLLLEEKAK